MIHQLLKDHFGYASFRPLQQEAIESVLDGKDVLLVLPTGGGKSICFQLPALAREGLSIVISPLIALMNDQVMALQQNGIKAYSLHSNIEYEDKHRIYNEIDQGLVKLLYISPEGLQSEQLINYLNQQKINLIAIDEAHCVSMWGNDFRPDYVKLSSLKSQFKGIPIMAVTATADRATQDDIVDKLRLDDPNIFVGSFERRNIKITASAGIDRLKKIKKFLSSRLNDAGIIYCTSRKSTESLSKKLAQDGYKVAHYHAGLDREERERVHKDFIYDRIQIVCATIAFGMGIDKSNIRYVIHYNVSKNIESYYQEIGRAGRDGSAADALLLYSFADINQLRKFIEEGDADVTFRDVQLAKLDRIWEFALTAHCRTNIILNYFGEFRAHPCMHCDNCLNPPETFDGTQYAQMALSAIARTREKLSFILLIDVLRGSAKQEIMEQGFQHIKTYGVGRHLPFSDWRSYITQLIHQGIISIDYTDAYRLKLTPLSKAILYENRKTSLVKYVWQDPKDKKRKVTSSKSAKNVDDKLYDRLRKRRGELAREQNVPAYVIFPNKTLEELASEMPTTVQQFALINGVGKIKLEKYANAFIAEINAFKDEAR